MNSRRKLLKTAVALVALSLSLPGFAIAKEAMPVVATFSILGDMVKRIGGEHVALTTLVGPDGDTHVYQPTPADARAVSAARVLFVNGLEFEGWLDRLIEASDFKGMRIVATRGIDAMPFKEGQEDEHGHHEKEGHHDDHKDEHADDDHHDGHKDKHKDKHAGDGHQDEHQGQKEHHDGEHHHDRHGHHHGAFDPHTWQSLSHAVAYVDNITAALSQADPSNASAYYTNRAAYVAEIQALNAEIKQLIASLPADRRTVVTSHDAFQYFGREYGLTFLAPQGLSTESEASAKGVAGLIRRIRDQGISAVFIENITDARLLKQIANETQAKIGGTLYPGALSGPNGPAPTYLKMMRHNATTLVNTLR